MVPAGVELIACRVDVVAEWCYCICAFSGAKRSMRKYRSWKQEKEKNAYLIEIEDILPAYSLSCINRNRLRKE